MTPRTFYGIQNAAAVTQLRALAKVEQVKVGFRIMSGATPLCTHRATWDRAWKAAAEGLGVAYRR